MARASRAWAPAGSGRALHMCWWRACTNVSAGGCGFWHVQRGRYRRRRTARARLWGGLCAGRLAQQQAGSGRRRCGLDGKRFGAEVLMQRKMCVHEEWCTRGSVPSLHMHRVHVRTAAGPPAGQKGPTGRCRGGRSRKLGMPALAWGHAKVARVYMCQRCAQRQQECAWCSGRNQKWAHMAQHAVALKQVHKVPACKWHAPERVEPSQRGARQAFWEAGSVAVEGDTAVSRARARARAYSQRSKRRTGRAEGEKELSGRERDIQQARRRGPRLCPQAGELVLAARGPQMSCGAGKRIVARPAACERQAAGSACDCTGAMEGSAARRAPERGQIAWFLLQLVCGEPRVC